MRILAKVFVFWAICMPAMAAETLVAARTIRSQSLLTAADLVVVSSETEGAYTDVNDLIGLEARVVLYEGRPIAASDVGPAAVIERNQIVTLVFRQGPLTIAAEGRSMSRAGVGDQVRVMNLASRSIIGGQVQEDGTVLVSGTLTFALR
jgi:flagella basal body P-ring formation protein FlgA